MSRWYDRRPGLGKRLDAFKEMDPEFREPIINAVIDLVKKHEPRLLSYEIAFDFPFDFHQRRWYDNDPHLWLMFNVLRLADERLLQSVEYYLTQEISIDHLVLKTVS